MTAHFNLNIPKITELLDYLTNGKLDMYVSESHTHI